MTTDPPRLTTAELAARRHLIGLTGDQLAQALGVTPRTYRAWELGRDPIPYRVTDELAHLIAQHTELAQAMLDAETPIVIPRKTSDQDNRPGGWYVAAAARAIAIEPDLEVTTLPPLARGAYRKIPRFGLDSTPF